MISGGKFGKCSRVTGNTVVITGEGSMGYFSKNGCTGTGVIAFRRSGTGVTGLVQ